MTRLTDVRVLEHEPLVELVRQPIHLAPDNIQKRLVIDQNLHTILLHLLVEHRRFINIFQVICQPGAALRPCANPYEFRLGLIEQLSQMRYRSRRELYCSFARAKIVSARSEGLRRRCGLRLLRFAFWYAYARSIVH